MKRYVAALGSTLNGATNARFALCGRGGQGALAHVFQMGVSSFEGTRSQRENLAFTFGVIPQF